jgi:putative Mg2+ transporter-C (MgtC) family protein
MDTIWQTVAGEFSDLPEIESATRVAVRLLVAAFLGGLIGWQREHVGKAAGVRTHMLVTLGSAAFVLIPAEMRWPSADLSRVVQGLVAGIGFLGAGTILKRLDSVQGSIHGLTTAADVWMTASVGISAGLGRLATASVIALLALIILSVAVHFGSRDGDGPAPKTAHGDQRKLEP